MSFQRFDVDAALRKIMGETESTATSATLATIGAQSSGSSRSSSDLEVWNAIQAGLAVQCRSSVLSETVYWVRDEKVRMRLQVRRPEAVIYTLSEIKTLAGQRSSPEHFKAIHTAKKILGGVLQ